MTNDVQQDQQWTRYRLRLDQIAAWLKTDWMPRRPDLVYETVWTTGNVLYEPVLQKLDRTMSFSGWRLVDLIPLETPVVHFIDHRSDTGTLEQRTGAYVFRFEPLTTTRQNGTGSLLEILAVIAQTNDSCSWEWLELACVPVAYSQVWTEFTAECDRLAYEREHQVVVVGGRIHAFTPRVDWDEVILPATLKADILNDIQSFYDKGVHVYRRLNLNPFRKLLFAGVPGTGKTMMCIALAKWALTRKYRVIYVSSAQHRQGDESGATFDKVQHALDIAAHSDRPALIILEELDAYLHAEEKALILNVLDGSEAEMNPHGTLLLATTNYPEAIDERVLKRPGRLDRVYIVPQTRTADDAEAMLRRYLGVMWSDAHLAVIPGLTGVPGAFIREVAIQALTRVAGDELDTLPLDVLREALDGLKAQIAERDAFVLSRADGSGEPAEPVEAVPMTANGVSDH